MKLSHLFTAAVALALGAVLFASVETVRPNPAPAATPDASDDDASADAPGETTSATPRSGEAQREPRADNEPSARQAFGWPSGKPVAVVRHFDLPSQPWAGGHRGVDLKIGVSQPVLASGDGVVIYAGMFADRPVVSIEHQGGLRTTYEPVEPAVSVGQTVSRGQMVGTLVGGHCHETDCLHWGAKFGPDGYIDPLGLLSPLVRLLE